MKKCRIYCKFVALVLAFVVFAVPVSADMQTYLDNVIVDFEPPKSYTGADGSTYLFGGSIHVRTPNMTLRPFTVYPPALNIGCGGIDFTFGAFRYFDPQHLVEFIKNIIQQAPAFGFQLAMDLFCPKCQEIFNKLSALANAINNMQLDSCQFLASAEKYLKDTLQSSVGSGTSGPAWMDEVSKAIGKAADFAQKIADFLNNPFAENTAEKWLNDGTESIVDRVFKNTYLNDDNSKNLIRTFFGDVLPEKTQANPKPRYIPPVASYNDLTDWLFTYDSPFITIQNAYTEVKHQNCEPSKPDCTWTDNRGSLNNVVPLGYQIAVLVGDVIEKYRNREALASTELNLLSTLPAPMIKLLNVASSYPGLLESMEPYITRYVAAEYGFAIIDDLRSTLRRQIAGLSSKDGASAAALQEQLDELDQMSTWLYEDVRAEREAAAEGLRKTIDTVAATITVENLLQQLISKSSFGPTYKYAKAMNTGR